MKKASQKIAALKEITTDIKISISEEEKRAEKLNQPARKEIKATKTRKK